MEPPQVSLPPTQMSVTLLSRATLSHFKPCHCTSHAFLLILSSSLLKYLPSAVFSSDFRTKIPRVCLLSLHVISTLLFWSSSLQNFLQFLVSLSLSLYVISFVIPVVFYNKLDCTVSTVYHNYLVDIYIYYLLHREQLHVSALYPLPTPYN